MNVAGSFVKCVNLKICINLIWPAVFEVYCQMAGRVQIKYQALDLEVELPRCIIKIGSAFDVAKILFTGGFINKREKL